MPSHSPRRGNCRALQLITQHLPPAVLLNALLLLLLQVSLMGQAHMVRPCDYALAENMPSSHAAHCNTVPSAALYLHILSTLQYVL